MNYNKKITSLESLIELDCKAELVKYWRFFVNCKVLWPRFFLKKITRKRNFRTVLLSQKPVKRRVSHLPVRKGCVEPVSLKSLRGWKTSQSSMRLKRIFSEIWIKSDLPASAGLRADT